MLLPQCSQDVYEKKAAVIAIDQLIDLKVSALASLCPFT